MTAPRISTDIDFGGRRVEHPPQNPSKAWQKANSVFCPLGPAPTTAWIVMQRGELVQLDVTQPYTLSWGCTQVTTDDASNPSFNTLTYQGLYIRHAERLFPGGDGFAGALYLVELVDGRYKAAQVSDSGSIVSNLRTYANINTYLSGSDTLSTWDQLLQALWDASSYLGNYPGIPETLPIDGNPSNHWVVGKNAYYQLCELLNFLDLAIQPNPSDGTFGLVQLGASQVISSNTSSLQFNGDHIGDELDKAANLEIYRMVYRKGYGQERDTEFSNNWAYDGFFESAAIPTGIPTGNGTAALWDDLPLILDENETPVNQASIDTRNSNIARRYATRKSVTSRQRVHYGLFASDYLPKGQIKATLWRNWGYQDSLQNRLGGTVTEFIAQINLVGGYEAGNEQGCTYFKELTIFNEAYAPPDLERRSYPNYPRLPNIIQVWHTDGSTQGNQVQPDQTAPNGQKFHSGRVKRWVANQMVTLDPCWILFVDNYDVNLGNVVVKQGEYFGPGRLSGITTVSANTYPVYMVRSGVQTSNEIVYFSLTQELFLQGQATAIIQQLNNVGAWVDTVPPQTITVIDDAVSVGCWAAYIGDKGHALLRQDGLYSILFMERPSLMMESFTRTDRDPNSAEIPSTFTSRYQQGGKLTPDEIASTGDDVTIFDSKTFYPRALKTGNSLAIWNDVRKRREAVIVQQQGILARAKLNQFINPEVDIDVTIISFQVITFSPFNLNPNPKPTTAINPFYLTGYIGDDILLTWDEDFNNWVIIQTLDPSRICEGVQAFTASKAEGDLFQSNAIVEDRPAFTARVMVYDPLSLATLGGVPCLLVLSDYDSISIQSTLVAENERIYGAAKLIGISPTNLPVYAASSDVQEWEGYNSSDISKGTTEPFTLKNRSGTDSSVIIYANVKYNSYSANHKAIVKLMTGNWIANQIEC